MRAHFFVSLNGVRQLVLVVCTVLCHAALAESIRGRVISIADGDTFTILDETNKQYKIRLAEIDAPEKKQPFGNRSKQSLAEFCFQKQATVKQQGTDRYGRAIGRVHCAGVDANTEQVRRGMAWVYDRYVTDRSLYRTQEEARAAHRGLWADPRPVPPWEWRRFSRDLRDQLGKLHTRVSICHPLTPLILRAPPPQLNARILSGGLWTGSDCSAFTGTSAANRFLAEFIGMLLSFQFA